MKFIHLGVSCWWRFSLHGRSVRTSGGQSLRSKVTANTNLQEHLFDIEEQAQTGASETPYYIVYPDEFGGNWRVQAVPVTPDSFESRKALPEQYAQGP